MNSLTNKIPWGYLTQKIQAKHRSLGSCDTLDKVNSTAIMTFCFVP